jgi:hypothetical protein
VAALKRLVKFGEARVKRRLAAERDKAIAAGDSDTGK